MKEKISGIVLGLIMISVIVAGVYGFYESTADQYGKTVDTKYSDNYNVLGQIQDELNDTYSDTSLIASKTDGLQFFSGIYDAFNTVKTFVKAFFTIPVNLIIDLDEDVPELPAWVKSALTAVITLVVIFALIYLLVGRES